MRTTTLTFSYRNSRSGSLAIGLGLVILIETAVFHLWLHARHPAAAWVLSIVSLTSVACLAADYHRLGRGVVSMDGLVLDLQVGFRAQPKIQLSSIVKTMRPTWKDLPTPGSSDAKEYYNLMKPAAPNVLIVLERPVSVLIANTVRVPARRIGLHLDDPDGFLAAINSAICIG